ncbi:MAG TPA: hypothetical protein VHO06_03460, partial [Polyangia bacterium]|nr:hypothetical protein [Polyangia bacterium]
GGAGGAANHDAGVDMPARDGASADAAPSDGATAHDAAVDAPPVSLIVDATMNFIAVNTCGVTPQVFTAVPAGSHTLTLTASNLSKGGVSGGDPNNPTPSVDNYVIVNLPLPVGDPQSDMRFFMLNGVGAAATFNLTSAGNVQTMFIDSDAVSNAGTGTVSLAPDGEMVTVDATANVLAWQTGCLSTPAFTTVSGQRHRVTLTASTLSATAGSHDDYVLVRIPDETPMNDHRYVMLNGVGSSFDFTPNNSQTVRAWFISAAGGATGQATLTISDL